MVHASHYSRLDPDERHFITLKVIRKLCIADQPKEIVEQPDELEKQGAGLHQIRDAAGQKSRLICDVSRKVMKKTRSITLQEAGLE